MIVRMRLDHRLIELGLVSARQKATDYIKSGKVLVDGVCAVRASQRVTLDSKLSLVDADNYVSRGAHKLAHGVASFKMSLLGKTCLDVGASTGGFTQVCLQAGATKVYAVDVGTSQLHESLRNDTRVTSFEQTNIKDLVLPDQVDFICVDVSFISLTHIIPALSQHLKKTGDIILLVKPQYEVGRENLPADGIVKSLAHQASAIAQVSQCATSHNFKIVDKIQSPLKGKAGNTEFLMHLTL